MRRLVPILIIAALAAAFAAWIAASPGAATLEFRGWVFETTAGAALFILLTLGVLMAVLWRSIGWLMNLPERLRDSAARSRQTRGYDALEKALIASASALISSRETPPSSARLAKMASRRAVAVEPGAAVLTVTPSGPNSRAATRVIARTDSLAAA